MKGFHEGGPRAHDARASRPACARQLGIQLVLLRPKQGLPAFVEMIGNAGLLGDVSISARYCVAAMAAPDAALRWAVSAAVASFRRRVGIT